jgi:hypothetical protein
MGFLTAFYSYGESKNTVDPGSIAAALDRNAISGDPNLPPVSSRSTPWQARGRERFRRFEWFKFGATTASFFWEAYQTQHQLPVHRRPERRRPTTNDLIYIHRDQSEMNFQPFTAAHDVHAGQQAAAVGCVYRSGQLSEQAPRPVRRALRHGSSR